MKQALHTQLGILSLCAKSTFIIYRLLGVLSPHIGRLHNINIGHVYDQLILPLSGDLSLSFSPSHVSSLSAAQGF